MKPTTYRCDSRVKVPKVPHGKPRAKNLSKERVYELVREIILERKNRAIKGITPWNISVTAEELAAELSVEVHKVTWALGQLNLRGLVTQKVRQTTRDFQGRRSFYPDEVGGWSASRYSIVLPVSRYNGPVIPPKPTKWPEGTIPVWDEQEPPKRPRFSKRLGYRLWNR